MQDAVRKWGMRRVGEGEGERGVQAGGGEKGGGEGLGRGRGGVEWEVPRGKGESRGTWDALACVTGIGVKRGLGVLGFESSPNTARKPSREISPGSVGFTLLRTPSSVESEERCDTNVSRHPSSLSE